MRSYTDQKPTQRTCEAIARILEDFWDVVLCDFASHLAGEPDECHTEHIFFAFVEVLGWLSDSEVWPADFVVLDDAGLNAIDLAQETLSLGSEQEAA